ncbi:hypothetical protein [Halorussus lipolyticus]|uniref:hypothetical protein n=1 Tax=Halorussus lipolyticus TaxID=3034024 RepID=UPI0023E7BD85|nr:hypothetical protein [Halorussus sp. DT80]
MFGPFRVVCEDAGCSFRERISRGETAQDSAEAHSKRHGHVVSITDVTTGSAVEIGF